MAGDQAPGEVRDTLPSAMNSRLHLLYAAKAAANFRGNIAEEQRLETEITKRILIIARATRWETP